MGEKDVYEKQYLSNPKYFSDIINFYFYGGRKIVKEKELVDINPDQVKGGVEHFRDVVKVVKKDNKNHYCIIGIENQTKVDKTMPVRCMVYDSNNLDTQTKHGKVLNASGKLIPVITLVIYWGAKPWNGPRTLIEMYQDVDKELLKYLPTYKINLIEPFSLTPIELNNLGEELKHLFTAVSLSNDKIKLDKYLVETEYFKECPESTAKMINVLFGIELDLNNEKYKRKTGVIDMCEAIKEIKADCKAMGLAEGKIENTIEIGKELNWTNDEIISRLVRMCHLSEEEATNRVQNFQA